MRPHGHPLRKLGRLVYANQLKVRVHRFATCLARQEITRIAFTVIALSSDVQRCEVTPQTKVELVNRKQFPLVPFNR